VKFAFVILNFIFFEWPEDYSIIGRNISATLDSKIRLRPNHTGSSSYDSLTDSPKTFQRYVMTEKSDFLSPLSILRHKKKGLPEQMANK
jgi:hypothetical protein